MKLLLAACLFCLPVRFFGQGADSVLLKRQLFVSDSVQKFWKQQVAIWDSLTLFQDTVYTWTKKKQIASLRKTRVLLTKSNSKRRGFSLYDYYLHDSVFSYDPNALSNYPLISLLREAQFSKKRFAWREAWPTVMGWKGEKYGNQLIQIVLNDSAIIGRFNVNPYPAPFRENFLNFYDFSGKKLSPEYVVLHKNRVAAVLHITNRAVDKEDNIRSGTYARLSPKKLKAARSQNITGGLMEYVIINESMVKSWSYGTQNIKDKLGAEIAFLTHVRDSLLLFPKNLSQKERHNYNSRINHKEKLKYDFYSRRSFSNSYYTLEKKKLKVVIRKLKKAKRKQSNAFSK